MVYLYALAHGLPRRLGVRGIDGEPLRQLSAGEVIAIAGELSRLPEPNEDALRTQDQLVRALHARADALLPARFGTTHDTDDALLAELWRNRERLEKALREVAGMEQMTLRIFSDDAPGAPEGELPTEGVARREAADLSRPSSHQPTGAEAASGTATAASFGGGLADVAHVVQAEVAAAAAALRTTPAAPHGGGTAHRGPRNTQESGGTPGAGTAYLERARARGGSAPGLDAIRAAVGSLGHKERIVPASTSPLRATVYHLIRRGSSERYLAAIDEAVLPLGVRVTASGPFPAYAFAPELGA